MRIVYIHQYFNTPGMPGATRSYELARRFVAAGHDVDMITTDRSDRIGGTRSNIRETREAGIRVHWLPVPYSNRLGYVARIRAFFDFAFRASSLGARTDADIVFATSTPLTVALPGIYAARRQGIPMIFEVRDLWPEVPIAVGALNSCIARMAARLLERVAYAKSAHIVALSPAMKDGIVAAGYPADQVTVVPNMSNTDEFDPRQNSGASFREQHAWLQSRPLVLYTGTIGLINNLTYMVGLAAEMRVIDPEVRFLIMGTGREEETVRRAAIAAGVLGNNLFILPLIAKNELPELLSAATFATSFVLNVEATWGNSANKIFDAFAAGRPLAINHGGWQADLLNETNAGIVLHPTDIPHAARQLSQRMNDKEWLQNARKSSRKLAEERFSADTAASAVLRVLTDTRHAFSQKTRRRHQ
jgi:glycosyltransferase involved in cell wall biosynthesis